MADLYMVKRKARAGEIGLFVNAEAFEEEFASIKMDAEVHVKATVEANAKYNRMSWHIANLVCQAAPQFETPEDARDAILIECRHFEMKAKKIDKLRDEMRMVPKPTRTLDGTAWLKLIRRMVHVATTTYGIPEGEISRNADFMATPATDAPPPAREEPPPPDTIPDGPGAPAQPEPAERSSMDDDLAEGDEEGGTVDAEPDKPDPGPAPGRQPIKWDVTMSGVPDWRIDLPADAGMYRNYFQHRLDHEHDLASMLVWFNGDAQRDLRAACRVDIAGRKQMESLIQRKEWKQ